MASFWERMMGRGNRRSGSTAKDRLRFVLIHDRINLTPERMEAMKEEILQVISKYVHIERDQVDIALTQSDRNDSRIIADIPFNPERSDAAAPEMDENSDRENPQPAEGDTTRFIDEPEDTPDDNPKPS